MLGSRQQFLAGESYYSEQWSEQPLATNNTYMSWAYHERSDIPFHFALSENYMICDMYQVCIICFGPILFGHVVLEVDNHVGGCDWCY